MITIFNLTPMEKEYPTASMIVSQTGAASSSGKVATPLNLPSIQLKNGGCQKVAEYIEERRNS